MFDYAKDKLLHEYSAYFGDMRGTIRVYAEGIVLFGPSGHTAIRNGYVESIRKMGETLLGKIPVEIAYYDMFGNREIVSLRMREIDYLALRSDLNK